MADAAMFTIGAPVRCVDGPAGTLRRIVVNPVTRAITHLVVESPKGPEGGVLAPVEGATSGNGEITLACTLEKFATFESADDAMILPSRADQFGLPADQFAILPYWTGAQYWGNTPEDRMSDSELTEKQFVTTDRVPLGEVEIRPGDKVRAVDGPIGEVLGLVVDPSDEHVTHVLLAEGHLFGKKQVAIPIGRVADLNQDGLELSLSKKEIEALPAIDATPPLGD